MMNLLSSVACSCPDTNHAPKLVVLTGGPGAGKTAILELARKKFCEHVAVLPEAASVVFGGGFIRRDTVSARKAAQRAIFCVQTELERLVIEEGKAGVILCDRGTLDGWAYWPNSETSFWMENRAVRESELARYSAVIHLRTPLAGNGYNHDNPVRIETPEQAAAIDARIVQAWEGHPNRAFVESSDDFLAKAERAMVLIEKEVPDCCRGR